MKKNKHQPIPDVVDEKTARHRKNMKRLDTALALIILIPALLYAADFLLGARRTVIEVDLGSGRIREQRHFLNFVTHEQIRDTLLTEALTPEILGKAKPDWRAVETILTARGHRLPSNFADVIDIQTNLPLFWKLGSFDPAAQRQSTLVVLELMKADGNDAAAGRYLKTLAQSATIAMNAGIPLHAADLPSSATAYLTDEGEGMGALLPELQKMK